MPLLAYGLIALAILGALGGIGYKLDHNGFERGKGEVQVAWDKANVAAQKLVDEDRARQDALRRAQDVQATRRLANEKKRTAGLVVSLEAHIRAAGQSAQCPMPQPLVEDWNKANKGGKI